MKISKAQFLFSVLIILLLAGYLAYSLGPEIHTISDKHQLSVEMEYLIIVVFLSWLLFLFKLHLLGILLIYGASLFFCFFYLFFAPFEAVLLMGLIFVPAVLWQKKKIGCFSFLLSGIALCVVAWKFFNKAVVPLLLLPTCHLLAVRVSTRVQSRFYKESTDIGNVLSRRQHKLRGKETIDWWDYVQPELESIPQKIIESWGDLLGTEIPREQSDKNTLHNWNLLQLQTASMMSKALTEIKKRDSNFAFEKFISRVNKVFWKIQNAWYSQKLDQIQHLLSDALFEQFKCQIEEQQAAGIRFRYHGMTIDDIRIAQVNSERNFDVLHVFIRASTAESLHDLDTDEELARNERRQFCEYWTFIRRPSAKTLNKPGLLEDNCPNCGAPIEIGQATVCKICKSFIRSGSYDWVLAKITQACEWDYYESSLLDGWSHMISSDPNFNIQQIEDRCGVIFWMQRFAERKQQIDPIRRFATESFCEHYFTDKGGCALPKGSFMENITLGSVRLQGFKLSNLWDRIFVLVVWSGVPVCFDNSGKLIDQKRITKIRRDVLVLIRRHGVQTDLKMTLTSAHCPNCGGPLSSSFTIKCNYCNSVLNEGTNSWILERVTTETDGEYLEIFNKNKISKVEKDHESAEVNSAKDVITIAAQMLLADGKSKAEEMALLEKIAASYAMKKEEINNIIYNLQNGLVHIPAPANSQESWRLLQSAARMALCDNQLSPEEESCLYSLAQYIGYSRADVKRALKAEVKRKFAAGEKIDPNLFQ